MQRGKIFSLLSGSVSKLKRDTKDKHANESQEASCQLNLFKIPLFFYYTFPTKTEINSNMAEGFRLQNVMDVYCPQSWRQNKESSFFSIFFSCWVLLCLICVVGLKFEMVDDLLFDQLHWLLDEVLTI